MSPPYETSASFDCFGSTCAIHVIGPGRDRTQAEAVTLARRQLLAWHDRFTRFEPGSELTRLNADPRAEVPVSRVMARFVEAAVKAAEISRGLVDATQLDQLEAAGYRRNVVPSLPLTLALASAPPRQPAGPNPESRWREVAVDPAANLVRRPPGLRLDSGGIAKGLFADLIGQELSSHEGFAVDCAGDLRLGGSGGVPRLVQVASPFDESVLHSFELVDQGIATSGIGERSWLDANGMPAHHLLDPASGRPAFTGIVQATALAPSAYEAELRAKAALLSGPDGAAGWLPHGGVVVLDDSEHEVFWPVPVRAPERPRSRPAPIPTAS